MNNNQDGFVPRGGQRGGRGRGGRGGRGGRSRGGGGAGMLGGGREIGTIGNPIQQEGSRPDGGNKRQRRPQGQGDKKNEAGNGNSPMDLEPRVAVDRSKIRTTSTTLSQMTSVRFDSMSGIGPLSQRALKEVFQFETATKVQAASLPICLSGADVMAKAKTGTGKTLSFLIPVVERLASIPANERRGNIGALVVSPTRELAQQIAEEGKMLTRFHNSISILCFFGGTNIKGDLSKLKGRVPDILVATPGRLLDHLANYDAANLVSKLCFLVFDEADQLLDMGFRPDILRIISFLPDKERRQTLLFSATFPNNVKEIADMSMRRSHQFLDTVGEEENTHQHVEQHVHLCGKTELIAALAQCLDEAKASHNNDYKIIVFFNTARITQLYAELFVLAGYNVLETHSRKSQKHRDRVSDRFRNESKLILFTSDVTARGMDYPDVTRVIQVGLPADRDQYIHRLGRTARAGRDGRGHLILCEFEKFFVDKIRDLPLTHSHVDRNSLGQYVNVFNQVMDKMPEDTLSMAYQAWLGFYNSNLRNLRWTKESLVQEANDWFVTVCRKQQPPALQAKTVGKMGLKGVPGLVIEGRSGGNGSGGGGGGGRGGFGGRGGRGGGPMLR